MKMLGHKKELDNLYAILEEISVTGIDYKKWGKVLDWLKKNCDWILK
jgi:hypothetical protein